MKKIILNTVVCCVVALLLFSYICIAVTQEANGASNLQYASDDEFVTVAEDEVVIHSPIKNRLKRAAVVSHRPASENDLGDADYDEMVKYLEKEKAYLEKLDNKYRTTLGSDVENEVARVEAKDENKVKIIQDNKERVAEKKDLSQPVTNPEKVAVEIDNKEGKGQKDQGTTSDFADLGNINYDNPYDAAEVFYEMSKYTEAIKMYKSLEKGMLNEKDYVWAQFQIPNSYRNLGKFDLAVQGYQDFVNQYPDNFWTEQALWYLEDAKWWKEWGNRITVNNE
ncbi:MAG: tetratricopeptide repeat protein [Candidatus Anammoxibacter sp.]